MGCPLVVHYWADLQSVHGLRCCGNITRNVRKYILALCIVYFCDQFEAPEIRHCRHHQCFSTINTVYSDEDKILIKKVCSNMVGEVGSVIWVL